MSLVNEHGNDNADAIADAAFEQFDRYCEVMSRMGFPQDVRRWMRDCIRTQIENANIERMESLAVRAGAAA